jgi:hypothetical protein
MQNKPNFQKSQMNVSIYNTTDYVNKRDWTIGQNKPNQTQSPKSPNECKLNFNKGLQKKRWFRSPKKQTQFLQRPKMSAKVYIIEDYENETAFRPKKTNPNKPNLESTLKSNAILDDINYGKFGRCCKSLIYKIGSSE